MQLPKELQASVRARISTRGKPLPDDRSPPAAAAALPPAGAPSGQHHNEHHIINMGEDQATGGVHQHNMQLTTHANADTRVPTSPFASAGGARGAGGAAGGGRDGSFVSWSSIPVPYEQSALLSMMTGEKCLWKCFWGNYVAPCRILRHPQQWHCSSFQGLSSSVLGISAACYYCWLSTTMFHE